MDFSTKKKGGMQFHIVQRHGSASTAVLKKIKKNKKNGKWKCVGVEMCVVSVLFFFSLSAVMWPSPPQPSTQNRACNWVWVCPLSPLFDGKGWIGKGIKRMLCPPHLQLPPHPARTIPEVNRINDQRNLSSTLQALLIRQCRSDEGMILLKWWSTSWEAEGV